MMEAKDPEIKLFGKKIAFLENGRTVPAEAVTFAVDVDAYGGGNDGNDSGSAAGGRDSKVVEKVNKVGVEEETERASQEEEKEKKEQEAEKDCLAGESCKTSPEERDRDLNTEESESPVVSSDDSDGNRAPGESTSPEPSNDKKEQMDSNNSQQKTLKKPDKILPCPRCNSMGTKFCYYNNYNVNQPRHFCKSCQRYWTAGGTMRNVPVGAGRRKSKKSASNGRHITITEALQATQIDAPDGYHHPEFNPNGTVLSFGPEVPVCDSMASVLNIEEKKTPNGYRNGYYKHEQGRQDPCKSGENGDDCSSGSSVTTSNSTVNGGKNVSQKPVTQDMNGFPSPVQCLPGVPWPFLWNPTMQIPAICPPGLPVQFYPAPYWNCGVPTPWSIPWFSPTSSTTNENTSHSSPHSTTLGKHSRDGELLMPSTPDGKESSEPNKVEGSVLVPKTLRIDDPDDAAKSSIWTTLGIQHDSLNKRGIFNAFQKCEEKKQAATPSPVLQANPAAAFRFLNFQESAQT